MQQIGGEIEVQLEAKSQIEQQIAVAKAQLNELKKKSMVSSSQTAKNKKKDADDDEPDIDKLMHDIRNEILNVYSIIGDPHTQEAKKTVDILVDVEL